MGFEETHHSLSLEALSGAASCLSGVARSPTRQPQEARVASRGATYPKPNPNQGGTLSMR